MRINYVLVDFENVTAVDLRDLNRDDVRVIIFLGGNQQKLPADLAIQMQRLGERGEYVQIVGNGPNALDFHIAFTIGERSASNAPAYFHIISKDTGFDPLIKYLKVRKILAARYKTPSEMPFVKAAQPKTGPERATYIMDWFSKPQATRPRTIKTLSNTIQTVFLRKLSENEVSDMVAVLEARKFIIVDGDKVTFTSAPA